MNRLQKLLDAQARTWEAMKEIRDRADENGLIRGEDEEAWQRANAEIEKIGEQIEEEQRNARFEKVDRSKVPGVSTDTEPNDGKDTDEDYRVAFDLWARFGAGELSPDQRRVLRSGFETFGEKEQGQIRAQGVGTTTAGGYTVPPAFRDKLVETLKYYSGMRQVAETITTETGATLPWMTNNDTANVGAILAENSAMAEQDVTFGTASLDVYMYSSKMIRVALQLIQDSALDINAFLPRKLGERIARIQNQHFTTGTGSSQPQGLITGATAIVAPVGSTTSFTYDTLVDVTMAIDPAYLQGGNLAWMGSQAAIGVMRKLKDTQNRPLWQPSLQAGAPDLFLGYPIVLNNDMAVPAVSAKSLAFGDFRAAYVIRDVTGVQSIRLDERYAEFLQAAFLAFQRSGGVVQDTNAVRVLQNSAT